MRTVREDAAVHQALDAALDRWPRAEDAWDAVTWALARDPTVGKALNETGTIRSVVFDGAGSIGLPSLDVIYEFDEQLVSVRDVRFYDAPYPTAGTA